MNPRRALTSRLQNVKSELWVLPYSQFCCCIGQLPFYRLAAVGLQAWIYAIDRRELDAPAAPARGISVKDASMWLGSSTSGEDVFSRTSRRPRSPLASGAVREISTSSRHGWKRFSKAQESVVQKAKSSPETNQRSQERSSSRLIRRKATSAKVDDSDLHTTRKIGDAGFVRPPAESLHEDNGGINLEHAISLLKAERESRTKHLRILLP